MFYTQVFVIFFLCASLFGGTINIAIATNVSYALEDLKQEFIKLHPHTKIKIILGSSGKLTAQISHGAAYDLFMSADMKYPNTLYKNALASTKPIVYAEGSLSLLSSKEKDYTKPLALLQANKIRKIAVANPKTSPYGSATLQALKNIGIYNLVKDKLIFGETISQTVAYTVNATDIGIVATSSLYSSKMRAYKKNVHWIPLHTKFYSPIKQGIVILKRGKNNTEVEAFYDFILSDKAKEILQNFGYKVSGL